jgi:hypothetical protein
MTDTRTRRPLILLAVLLSHIAMVSLVLRADRQRKSPSLSRESLVRLILPNGTRNTADLQTLPQPEAKPPVSRSKERSPNSTSRQDDVVTVTQEKLPPAIDWEKEAAIASKNAITNADMQNAYRNLSALSPAQRSWVRQNYLEPARPGIQWKYRRVEVAEGGFPIIHINDHCIVVPFLMMMVFCQIGHIEPKGDLFDHMRDAHGP